MDKSIILNKIREYLKLKSDAEFASFLGIKPTTLSSWRSRNTYDLELLYSKCGQLNPEWLLTGTEPMLKEEKTFTLHEPEELYLSSKSKDELYERLIAEKEERIKDLQRHLDEVREQLSVLDRKVVSAPKAAKHTS